MEGSTAWLCRESCLLASARGPTTSSGKRPGTRRGRVSGSIRTCAPAPRGTKAARSHSCDLPRRHLAVASNCTVKFITMSGTCFCTWMPKVSMIGRSRWFVRQRRPAVRQDRALRLVSRGSSRFEPPGRFTLGEDAVSGLVAANAEIEFVVGGGRVAGDTEPGRCGGSSANSAKTRPGVAGPGPRRW